MMHLPFRLLLSWWLSAWLLPASAQTTICPRERIRDFEAEHELGVALLPPNVVGEKKLAVYVTQKNGRVYVQSNFRPTEAYPHPIKIATKDSRSLYDIVYNVISFGGKVEPDFNLREAYEHDLTFIFDEAAMTATGSIDLDIGSHINNQLYVLPDGSPPPRRLRQIKSNDVPPNWMAEYDPSVFAKVKVGFHPNDVLDRLQKIPFHQRDMQLISFLHDTKVEARLAHSTLAGQSVKLTDVSEAGLEKLFATYQAPVITLLGHSDGESFLISLPGNSRESVRISFATIQTLAAKYRKEVIYLGCDSYLKAGLGANQPFNPLTAIRNLERAVQANNLRGFLQALATSDLGIVMDETAFAHVHPEGDVGEVATEESPAVFNFSIVRKVRAVRTQRDQYQLDVAQPGTVRFVTGFRSRPSAPMTRPPVPVPDSDSVNAGLTRHAARTSPAPDFTDVRPLADSTSAYSIPAAAGVIIVAMCLLAGSLIFVTFRQDKNNR